MCQMTLIPVDVGYFSVDGLENMLEIVERIKHSHNRIFSIRWGVARMCSKRHQG